MLPICLSLLSFSLSLFSIPSSWGTWLYSTVSHCVQTRGKVLYLATRVKTEKGLGEETKMCWFYVSHSQKMTVALGDCKAFSPVTQVVISGAGSLNLGQQGSKSTYCFHYTTLFIISSKNRVKCNFGATRMSSRLFVNKQNRTWLLGLIMWLWRERPD